jgi:hypothetical protein
MQQLYIYENMPMLRHHYHCCHYFLY